MRTDLSKSKQTCNFNRILISISCLLQCGCFSEISDPFFISSGSGPETARYGDWLPRPFPESLTNVVLYRNSDLSISLIQCTLTRNDITFSGTPLESLIQTNSLKRSHWPARMLSEHCKSAHAVFLDENNTGYQSIWRLCWGREGTNLIMWQEYQ